MKNSYKTAFIVAILFMFFGFFWIIFSDIFLLTIVPSLEEFRYFQTSKGLLFVVICTVFIYFALCIVFKKIKKQEERIIAGEENYKKLFMNNPMPMWVYDMKTLSFLEVNNAAIDCYGYSKEEFLEKTLFDIRPPDDHEELMRNVATDENKYFTLSGVWRHVKKDGTIIFVEINSHPIEFNNRQAKIVLALDISERKVAEREIQALIFELDNFVYRASHDLRGPLARLKGLSQIALMETQDEVSRNYFNMIKTSANVLDNTLLRLLSINNLKHTVLEEEDVNIHNLIEKIVAIKKEVMEGAGISFYNEISQDLTIHADQNVLRLAIQNILDNSIQYRNIDVTEPNRVYIKVSAQMENDKIKILFEDNGIGIEESQTDKIFNIFYRGTVRSKGSGLGLYIAKIAMDKIKGSIHLSDHQKNHTVFELVLPSKNAQVATVKY